VSRTATDPGGWRQNAGRQAFIERLIGMGFAFPACRLRAVITIVPLIGLVSLSFTNYELGATDMTGVGLGNYAKAMADPVFRRALKNTFVYVALVLPGAVLLGLFIAILVQGRTRTRAFYQIIYFLPVTSTLIAMATVWQALLHPRLGPVSATLRLLGIG